MIVICLEGCHGCGKSTLTSLFEMAGYTTLDEAFLDMPKVDCMSPQTMLMESIWIGNWFSRLLKLSEKTSDCDAVYIADRSPFSAVCYAGAKGHLLDPVIRAQIEEVWAAANIEIYSVHLQVEDETLWSRIQARLEKEPGRTQLREDKRSHMDAIHGWYKSFKWDFVVDNTSEGGGERVINEILENIRGRSKRFRALSGDGSIGPNPSMGSPTSVTTKWSIE